MRDPIEVVREAIETATQSGLERAKHHLQWDEYPAVKQDIRQLELLKEIEWLIGSLWPSVTPLAAAGNGQPLRVLAGSLFLEELAQHLVRDSCEDIAYVTGVEVAGVFVLSQMLTFATEHRSAVAVRGEFRASSDRLVELETRGHRLLAWAHSHPGTGRESTRPSSTDLAHQQRLEQGGHRAVGLIVSRDGHLRFFSRDLQFKVAIYGKGVRQLDGRNFALDLAESRH